LILSFTPSGIVATQTVRPHLKTFIKRAGLPECEFEPCGYEAIAVSSDSGWKGRKSALRGAERTVWPAEWRVFRTAGLPI